MKFFKLILILWACTVSFSCKQSKEIIPSADFAPYISAFTGGIADKNATIIIQFTEEQPDKEIEKQPDKKLFSFSPSLKGSAHWINNKTLEFIPETGALKQGTTYNVSFALGKIMKVDKQFSKFNFSFKVKESDFAIFTRQLEIQPDETITVRGELSLSDMISMETAKKMITAKIAGKAINVTFEEQNESNKFKFLISGISKEDKAKELNIYVDGAPAKIDRKETVAVEIPAKDIFQLYHQEIAYSPDYKISLIFSNIISESQNLKGLVTVKELKDYTLEVNSNILIIHFSRPSNMKELEVTIDQGLKNNKKESLGETKTLTFPLDQLKPCVELLTSGVIIPDEGKIILPFRAVSLRAVDLKIIRVFENNIFMFLQDNKMDRHSSFQMRRSGRLIYKETLKLDKDFSNWENYSLDLTGIIKQRPGDIYRIELSFKQNYALYECDSDKDESSVAPENAIDLVNLKAGNNFSEEDETFWDTPDDYYYENYDINFNWSQYDWQQRDNPCHPTYYMQNDRKASTNVFVSNIGLIAKINSNNTLWITASDLRDTKPIADAEITVYNFQQQPLATVKTDNSGFAVITLPAKPFAVIASSGNQKAYLRLVDGEENMLSRFDVGGVEINKGLKGFIYGERGVWRPGDTLHIAFMLEDKTHKIPDNHPVSFELFNPRGQFYKKIISSEGLNGLYTFDLPTKPEDPTGLWNAYIKIGGATFHKSLRIETIKPNRLKIKLDVPDIIDGSKEIAPVGVQSSWLTGATASELNVKLDLTLSKSDTQFKGYEKYIFNNPISRFTSSASEVYETKLDNNGKASIDFTIPKAENAPGILKADFICRVFEPGGDASIYAQSLPFSPFPAYIGINFNITDSYLITDQDNVFDIVTLSPAGKPVNLNDLEYNIYRIGWSWWWESQGEQFDSYINNSNYKPVFSGKINTVNGKGKIKFRINYPDWGRYFIYVNDPAGGHGTGGTVLVDWAEWRGRSNKQDPDGIKMLTFAIDKDNYETGDNVTVTIPAVASGGSALLALENGSEVITREWVHLNSGEDTKYSFKVTNKMTPNVYIHISLLQPHKAATDLPIRMYGVKPVFVSDKNTVLNPVITMPDVLKPESVFELKVKEQSGKPMTYTLAIVDDGLLDLTNFKTPDPWNTFYAREALGIRTWDLYDNVMGAFTGRLGSMFSIGGDGELLKSPTKANRFKPVVLFLGPVSLKAGEEKKHSLQLPAYVGSVRAMIVACQEGAYGKADKTAAVRSPLMTLSSLPRILSTDEKINLPVNVFVSEQDLKKVTVKIETEGKLKPIENNVKSINFDATGDQLVYFPMKTGSITGTEKVTITATAGNHTFKETVEIEIRNPNPPVLTFKSKLLEKGESIDYDYSIDKEYDDNRVSVEMSRIPNVDLKGKLDYLHDYYHYCSEQLVSRALPLLYVSDFKNVDEKEKKDINKSVTEAINNLYMRQSMNGGFMYWTGSNTVDEWITSYTGNFLAVAKERGFAVNNSVMDKWVKYQKMKAQNWRKQVEDRQSQSDYIQAYRLYTLALAGSPDLGAMNRLKEVKDIALQSRWRLAAAYSLCGKNDAANELVFNASKEVSPYSVNYLTYGSSDKDEAMILEALVLLNKKEEAFKQAQKVAANLTGVSYYSTQYFAVAISAMGQFASKFSGNLDFQYTVNGKTEKVSDSKKALYHKDLPLEPSSGKVKIVNGQEGVLYTSISTKSRPLTDNNPEMNNNIRLEVSYTDLKGNTISVDNLEQGTDFNAVIKVSNISGSNDYRNIALTQIIPSGWEIINRNMFIAGDSEIPANKLFTYQDIRDDRVLTYFDLSAGTSKEFKISLQTSYIGDFVLPAVLCEAMYDPSAYARTKAGRVSVVENEGK
ncbi:MAG: alpha-2-macroglobulin [Tannerella sp.]|jgi:uncharacterized protein YfaS (alpha-2-macroglobulin family)|nr:alpha-2-macroglobulin [Tannerella sp.]